VSLHFIHTCFVCEHNSPQQHQHEIPSVLYIHVNNIPLAWYLHQNKATRKISVSYSSLNVVGTVKSRRQIKLSFWHFPLLCPSELHFVLMQIFSLVAATSCGLRVCCCRRSLPPTWATWSPASTQWL
jgi:hypothetical protein